MRLSEAIEQLKYYQSKPYVPTVKKVCNIALETIEALRQENERLNAQVARMREACILGYSYLSLIFHRADIKNWNEVGMCSVKDIKHVLNELESAYKGGNTPADYHNPADVEALRKARTAINNILYTVDYYIAESEIVPNEMHKRHINEAKEALAEIDKTLGGGQE